MSKSQTRKYLVRDLEAAADELPRIVVAPNQAQAIGYVVRDRFEAVPLDVDTAMELARNGVAVENAATGAG